MADLAFAEHMLRAHHAAGKWPRRDGSMQCERGDDGSAFVTAGWMLALGCLTVALCVDGAHAAELDCARAHWYGHDPAINVGHIFCGELRGHADGYHSEAIFPTPLVSGVSQRVAVGHGLYDARVDFADGEHKHSTFYPRRCTPAQIVESVAYAVAQPRRRKRGGWGYVALSAPANATEPDRFCVGDDGVPFAIRFGLLSRGDVNTAFPDVETEDAR